MLTSAHVESGGGAHRVTVRTDGRGQALAIAPKADGAGSSVNGGELLALALATCYCNDLYREAARRGIAVAAVEVAVDAEFGAAGEPARGIRYRVQVTAEASAEAVAALVAHTDRVAEVHNTLRAGIAVELVPGPPTAPAG